MLRSTIRQFTVAAATLVSAAALTALAAPASTAMASTGPAHASLGRHTAAPGILGSMKQAWSHRAPASGGYGFITNHDGLCLGISGGRDQAPAVQWGCENTKNQLWTATNCVAGFGCQLINEDKQCLGVQGGSTNEGARVYGWTCNGHPDQYWSDFSVGNYFVVVNSNSGLVLGVAGGSTKQGAAIVQWPYELGVANQLWY